MKALIRFIRSMCAGGEELLCSRPSPSPSGLRMPRGQCAVKRISLFLLKNAFIAFGLPAEERPATLDHRERSAGSL